MRRLHDQIGWVARVQWLMGLALAVFVVGWLLLGYRPAVVRRAELAAQRDAKSRQLQSNQARAEVRPLVEDDVRELKREMEKFDKKLPKQQDFAGFINDITTLSRRSDLRGLDIKPAPPKWMDSLAEFPITMSFHGDFLSVFSFLRQTEDLQRLTRVRGLSIKRKGASAPDEDPGQVEVQLSMNIYYSEG